MQTATQKQMHQIIALLCLIFVIGGAGGVSIIWMRQRISHSASEIKAYERELADVNRRAKYLDARLAELENPQRLKVLVKQLDLGLRLPDPEQVVRVDLDEAVSHTTPSGVAQKTDEPFLLNFDLAVMEGSGRSNSP